MDDARMVWMLDERVLGYLENFGTYYSRVSYTHEGIDYEDVLVENDEFCIL